MAPKIFLGKQFADLKQVLRVALLESAEEVLGPWYRKLNMKFPNERAKVVKLRQ